MHTKPEGILLLIALSIVALSGYAGCDCATAPTVERVDVVLRDITLTTIELDLRVTVNNPHPFSITLNRIAYDIFYERGDEWQPLGQGDRSEDVRIKASGLTTVEIPATIGTAEAVQALIQMLGPGGGELTLKASGSVWLDVELASIRVPFETTQKVSISFPADLIDALQQVLV